MKWEPIYMLYVTDVSDLESKQATSKYSILRYLLQAASSSVQDTIKPVCQRPQCFKNL